MAKDSGRSPSPDGSGSGCQPSASAPLRGSSQSGIPNAVTVTAADWNGQTWDGSPFDPCPWPDWLIRAVEIGHVAPDCPDSTDYAVWWVHAPYGKVIAEPGDKIVCHEDGALGVIRYDPKAGAP